MEAAGQVAILAEADPAYPTPPKSGTGVPGVLSPPPKPRPPGVAPLTDVEPSPPPSPPDRTFRPPGSPIVRLASVPNMFGDFLNPPLQLRTIAGNSNIAVDLPTGGGATRMKAAENNKAVPMDRCYFTYNHYHNAIEVSPQTRDPDAGRSFSTDRYVVGLEKTFFDDLWSIDVRLPLARPFAVASPDFSAEGGRVGNLWIGLKRSLWASEWLAASAGLGIDTPTGSDATSQTFSPAKVYTVHNEAVHLAPFVGFLAAPDDRLFCHGFLQVDVPANGNPVDASDPGLGTTQRLGTFTEQTLLALDVAAGYWLYRNRCAAVLTGLAPLVEFHYTTTLQDADALTGALGGSSFNFVSPLNRLDVVNVTVGIHAEIARRTELRVGGAFPLDSDVERLFDAEVLVSLNRRF